MKISNKDWVQISTFLDGEMNPREAKRLEERFKKEPDLQHALEELRLAKMILRTAPKLNAPRDFTIRPEMVGIKPLSRPRPARAFRLASALMSFMLIGILLLDFGRVFVGGAMAPAAPKELMVEAFPESAADAVEEPTFMEAEADVEDRAVTEPDAELSAVEVAEAPAVAAEAVEEGESVGFVEEAETKSSGEGDQDTAANQTDEWQGDDSANAQAVPTQTIQNELLATGSPPATEAVDYSEDRVQRVVRKQDLDPFRILEVILGLGAVTFGIAAWVIRRRNS